MVIKGFYGVSKPLLLPKGFEQTLQPGLRLLGERARRRVMGLFRSFFLRTGFFVSLVERTDGIGQFPRICHGVMRHLDSLDRVLEILRSLVHLFRRFFKCATEWQCGGFGIGQRLLGKGYLIVDAPRLRQASAGGGFCGLGGFKSRIGF